MRPAAALLLLALPLAAAPVPKALKKPKSLEDQLLGKWVLVASRGRPTPNSVFRIVFLPDGELEFRNEYPPGNGQVPPTPDKGTYTLGPPTAEDPLGTIDWKVMQNRSERSEVSRITELSADVLEFKDPVGVVERFERAKKER